MIYKLCLYNNFVLQESDGCSPTLPDVYIVYLIDISDPKVVFKSDVLTENNNLQLVFYASSNELPFNRIYHTIIETINNAGRTNSTGNDLIISKCQNYV